MRYAPSSEGEQQELLRSIGAGQFEDLLEGIPEHLRMKAPIPIQEGVSEMEVRARIEEYASMNRGSSGETDIFGVFSISTGCEYWPICFVL